MITNNIYGEPHRPGRIEVVCGSMFSGKTEELIRRLKRAKFAKQRVEIFKPSIDVRYSEEEVVSHDQNSIMSTPIDSSSSILLLANDIDVIGIDEAQFLDEGLVDVCNQLANRGVRVIIAGLDMDYRGVPFGPIPGLCAIADEVTKVHAICVKCGALAYVSHRLVESDKRVLLGETRRKETIKHEEHIKTQLTHEEPDNNINVNKKKEKNDNQRKNHLRQSVSMDSHYTIRRCHNIHSKLSRQCTAAVLHSVAVCLSALPCREVFPV